MGKGSKKLYWAGAGAAFLLVVLLALAVILPRIIDSAWLKETIQTRAAEQVNGKLDFQKAEISILPFPYVALQQVSLNIPETANINLDTIKVYPKLFPLLIGNIKLDKIVIDKPDFSLPLPEKSEKKPEKGKALSLSEILETSTSKLSPVLAAISGLEVNVHKGVLRLFAAKDEVFLVENINASFAVSSGTAGLMADIQISGASLTAFHKDEKIRTIIDNLKGNIQLADQQSSLTVEDLTLSSPQIKLSSSFNFDKTVPGASLDIKSQSADITGIREVLPIFINVLYGDLPMLQEIFDIVRGGSVNQASFRVEGKSPEDLAKFESMVIQGQVKDGKISLADLGLDLQGVNGEIAIAKGVLEGKNLQAKMGNTTAKNGSLTHDLVQKETTPFHLDLDLNADLSDLVPVLKQMLPDENSQYYLSLIESLAGTSQAKLTLGESLESLNAKIEVNKINAQGKYKPVPFPLIIDGGRILFDGYQAESHNLQGKLGKSTFNNLSLIENWADKPTIDIQSGTFQIVLDEIYPWLASFEELAKELENITEITGIADITVKSLKGTLLPANLQYEVHGSLKDIDLTANTIPGPLNIETGQINIEPDKITFKDLHANLLDSTLTYSGVLQNFLNGKTNAEVIVTNAEIGAEVNDWFVEQIKVPKEYIFRTPLLISRAHAKWTRDELLDLQGDFSIENGPIFTVDTMLNPDELVLRNLGLKSGDDQASIKLHLKKRIIGAEFQGSLSQKTIDKIMLHNEAFPDAWIKGDIHFNIDMDSLATSAASGKLDGGKFIIPLESDKHFLLDSFSLTATDKAIKINSAEVEFENKKYSINGQASLAQERLSIDMEVKTDTVELDKILAALQTGDEKESDADDEKRVGKSWDLTIHGKLKLHTDSLLYNGYTWKPFESLITFENNSLGIDILTAELCNLSTPGKISFHDDQIALDFKMEA
ncbi:MAG: AsmA family protein, partial [Desulfobacterales bacterium]|nr:AsmA family protein [Desulfobacterales bacterium]